MENMDSEQKGPHYTELFEQDALNELYSKFASVVQTETDLISKPIVQMMYEWYIVPQKDKIIDRLKNLGYILSPMDIAIFLQEHCICVYFGKVGVEGRDLTREEKNWLSGIAFWESTADEEDAISLEQSITEQRALAEDFVNFSIQGLLPMYAEKYNLYLKPHMN